MSDSNARQFELENTTASLLTHNLPEHPNTRPMGLNPKSTHVIEQVLGTTLDTKCSIMCYIINTRIGQLDGWKLPRADRIRINIHGLHIFLYEPMSSYIVDDPQARGNEYNMGFYSEIPANQDISRVYSSELDSIQEFADLNGLSNVTVHTCDYEVDRYYGDKYTIKLITNDLFLQTLNVYDNLTGAFKTDIRKPFISCNWRFTANRCIVASLIVKQKPNLGWYYRVPHEILDNSPWFSWAECKQQTPELYKTLWEGLTELNANTPHCLDLPVDTFTDVPELLGHYYPPKVSDRFEHPFVGNATDLPLEPFYAESFVDIVNETRFAQPTANLSEKTYQAIQFMTPFILIAPANSLKYLKELGFKTFDTWWDESYDQEPNHFKRLAKISDIVQRIGKMSISEMTDMYAEMLPVLEHNFAALSKVTLHKELSSADINMKEVKHMAVSGNIDDSTH